MPSLPSSTPDDFKDGFDLKTSDLPRKPKLVVGGKSVCQDAQFPSYDTCLDKDTFILVSALECCLPKEFQEGLCKGLCGSVAFRTGKRTRLDCLIRLYSSTRLYPRNPILDICWLSFNHHPFCFELHRFLKSIFTQRSETERLAF